jgi:hypothetical protein
MPDNSARIAAIRAILRSGVRSTTVDGVTTVLDHDTLRKELAQLIGEDESLHDRRPRAASIYLGGF